MALQLEFSPTTEADMPPIRKIGQSRPEEPAVPVYRHFLSGGPGEFRLGVRIRLGLTAASMVGVFGAAGLAGRLPSPSVSIGMAILAALVCVPLAALVARWAGRSSGLLTGLLAIAGWMALSFCSAPSAVLAAASASAAILVYSLAELPHRNPILGRPAAAVLFYLGAALSCTIAGPAALAPIAAVCLGTIVGNENSRGTRFFISPTGLAILGIGLAMGFFTPAVAGPADTHWPQWLAVAGLLAGMAWTWALVRTGHGASPFGRLLITWLLGPSLLGVAGMISVELATAVTLPAWAAVVSQSLIRLRRGSGRWVRNPL